MIDKVSFGLKYPDGLPKSFVNAAKNYERNIQKITMEGNAIDVLFKNNNPKTTGTFAQRTFTHLVETDEAAEGFLGNIFNRLG